MSKDISNTDDVIDSCDIIARIAELTDEREALEETVNASEESVEKLQGDGTQNQTAAVEARRALAKWLAGEEGHELKALEALQEEAEGYAPDWRYGCALIRESYFEDYARELAADIGAVDPKATWPNDCIDWERAADELKYDYTCVDFDGVEYWVR